jgi:hypothetical protein
MKKYFYSHLIDSETLLIKLQVLKLTDEEREHLLEIAHDTLHHHVLDLILSKLNQEEQQQFLTMLLHEQHDEIWEHITKRIENIEDKIRSTVKELQDELHKDIEETKNM